MPNNIGYLTSDKTESGDEIYTPYYGVEPLLKYISKDKIIWTCCDCEWSAFYNLFKENGYRVIRSSLSEGQDFFEYEPNESYDIIITNPPFSKKDKILKRLYELNKPFAILLPMNSLQGQSRYKYFKNGIQLLAFDKRISFHSNGDMVNFTKGSPFASAYFCNNVLPKDLILEELVEYERPLIKNPISAPF